MSFKIAKDGSILEQLEMFDALPYAGLKEKRNSPPPAPAPPITPHSARLTISYAQAYTAFLDQLQNAADPWEAEVTIGDETQYVQFCDKDGDWSFFSAIRAAEDRAEVSAHRAGGRRCSIRGVVSGAARRTGGHLMSETLTQFDMFGEAEGGAEQER